MHRSPLSVLVIVAALAACSTRDMTAETELLSQDSALVARLAPELVPRRVPLPDACGTVATAAPPAVADMSQSEELAHRAFAAEALGDLQEARSLLRRASDLDGTNESAAYHLGRTSEALGDRAAAIAAYCRFLALTPTATESAEARQRVATLSQPEAHVASATVSDSSPKRRRGRAAAAQPVTRRPSTVVPRVVAGTTTDRAQPAASPAPRAAATTSPAVHGAADTAPGGEVVAAIAQEPSVVQPSTASRTSSAGPSRAQSAGIGAAAGAIIGAATGRSVKGALIGAAAGGLLGTAMGGRIGTAGRGIRP